jgi:hypothetical protein
MEANQLKLYKHFIAIGEIEKAKAYLTKYPHFAKEVKKSKK